MALSDILKNIFYILLIFTFAQPFIRTIKTAYTKTIEPRTKVAYLEINGTIADSTPYVRHLQEFFKDQEIKAILLKIESTGGTAGSSQALFHELLELKKENPKQVAVLVENVCASGAYCVASGADHIVASPVAWIGSIGAYIPFQFKLKEFINSYKIQYESTKAGAYKNFSDPFVDTTPEQAVMLQKLCDQTYEEFTQAIANRRRKLSMNTVNVWANGKVFTGRQALELGLIDELGSKSNAVTWIKEKALIEGKIEWVRPSKPFSWANLFEQPTPDDSPSEVSIIGKITDTVCARLEHRYSSHGAQA
jgi:protease-4